MSQLSCMHLAIKILKISWKHHIFENYKAENLLFILPTLLLFVISVSLWSKGSFVSLFNIRLRGRGRMKVVEILGTSLSPQRNWIKWQCYIICCFKKKVWIMSLKFPMKLTQLSRENKRS